MFDSISINDLELTVPLVGGAVWPNGSPQLQPVRVSISLKSDITIAALTDDLEHSIDYSEICVLLTEQLCLSAKDVQEDTRGYTLELLANLIFSICFTSFPDLDQIQLELTCVRAPLHCRTVGMHTTWCKDKTRVEPDFIFCRGIECSLIIGVNPCERVEQQIVSFDVTITQDIDVSQPFNFRDYVKRLHDNVVETSYQTLEALASHIAQQCLSLLPTTSPIVTVWARKPSALVFASSAEVQITRTTADYPSEATNDKTGTHRVALALGSNLGDRLANIEHALRLIENPLDQVPNLSTEGKDAFLSVVETSFLYESAPMYVTDQPAFLNAACLVETNLPPRSLLSVLKAVEATVGRVPSIRNGPRTVDLDIMFYGDRVIDTRSPDTRSPNLDDLEDQLVVPHPRMAEREFVLQPLADIMPDFSHPVLRKSVRALLEKIREPMEPLRRVTPFPKYPSSGTVPETHSFWTHPSIPATTVSSNTTQLMATLNVTPDSFSDGSKHNTLDTALEYAQNAISQGANIIDVGGYSTRPGAAFVSTEEEIERVVPVVSAIRSKFGTEVLISIDTFRPEVARAAVLAGANCINDVYAFCGPDSYPFDPRGEAGAHLGRMRSLARELAVPVILMHSRGDAGKNKDYDEGEVVQAVQAELGAKVDRIVKGKGGVRRWYVIVDPGVGFSKTLEGNLQVLKNSASIVSGSGAFRRNPLAGYPLLIGVSRKSFLGVILAKADEGRQTEPKDRVWATAAAVACAVQQGSMVVRVHDVAEMRDVVTIAEALWGMAG